VIISVASFKGGVGKTTTALHLAGLLADSGPTLLVDDDPNQSAQRYAGRGGDRLPFEVLSSSVWSKQQPQVEHQVFDTPARAESADVRSLARGSDLVVLVSSPDPMSLEALLDAARLLDSTPEARYRVLLTLAPPYPETDAAEAREALEAAGVPLFRGQVRRAKAFQKAAMEGVLVYQTRDPRAKMAWLDYRAVFQQLRDELEVTA
jgi:chromosome partitioning protein